MADAPSRTIRLNRYIAQCGVASRRKADDLIEEGLVKVNGKCVFELGAKVDPSLDKISVKGRLLSQQKKKYYLVFNKPKQMVTTLSDPEGRPTVGDSFKHFPARLFPVGRLDWDTEGLLLMTNDGDFAQKVSHPSGDIAKTYLAKIKGDPTHEELGKLLKGVSIPGGRVAAKLVQRVPAKTSSKNTWIKIIITEGKNRQVRWMFRKIGYDVLKLKRTAIGRLQIGGLKIGDHRVLMERSLDKIFQSPFKAEKRDKQRSMKRLPPKKR